MCSTNRACNNVSYASYVSWSCELSISGVQCTPIWLRAHVAETDVLAVV
jgi:hypothetical protein